jgi:hypothetical protein
MEDRFARQRRLPEIGERGQALIGAECFRVAAGREASMERDYLARAGAGMVAVNAELSPEPFAHAACFRHEAPRRHAAAAWRAFRQIMRLVARAD